MNPNRFGRFIKRFALGGTVFTGSIVTASSLWYRTLNETPFTAEIAREVKFKNNPFNKDVLLFQFHNCPFSSKVRSYLDLRGINYKIIEVNSLTKGEMRKWTKYKKVPIIVTTETNDDGKDKTIELNDSSVIISVLESYLQNNKVVKLSQLIGMYPKFVREDEKDGRMITDYTNKYNVTYDSGVKYDEASVVSEMKLRRWIDDKFVHVISPNIYRSVSESINSFKYFSQAADWDRIFGPATSITIVYLGALVMRLVAGKLKRKYELNSDERLSLYFESKRWTNALKGQRFMGGNKPTLSDISFYGTLTSFEGCQAFTDMMNQNDILYNWFKNVRGSLAERVISETNKQLDYA